jgi:hypothetical protein
MTARRDDGIVLLLILLGLLLLMLCIARPAHAQVTIADQIVARQKAVIGTTTASSSPLTVVGLPGSGDILRVGAGGSIGIGSIGPADIPAVFTRRDLNEAISGAWSFNGAPLTVSGGTLALTNATSNVITFPGASATLPTIGARSPGTRLLLWPDTAPTALEYAIGMGPSTLWTSVPAGARVAWFASDGDAASETGTPGEDLLAELTSVRNFLPGVGYSGNLGLLNRKWLTLHAAELWVETLVAQETIATIGGRILVGPTTQLTTDIPAASGSINVKHNNLVSGDVIYLEANGRVEFMRVTSSAGAGTPLGAFAYTVTRDLDGSGANDWAAGDAAFNTGQAGSGFIDLYSIRGTKAATELGPTIVGNVRTSTAFNGWAPRWAIGNLQGLYGYSSTTYGSAFGDPSATFVAIDATNGFRVLNGGTTIGQWDTAGVVTIGPATSSTTGKMVIDSDSVDVSYRGSTLFSIYSSSGSSLAQFNTPLWTMSGLYTPSITWLSSSMTIATSPTFSNITLQPGAAAPTSGAVLPGLDAASPLGSASKRWNNVHLVLPVQSASGASAASPGSGFPYLVTGDRTELSRLGYYCGSTTYNFPIQANSACVSGYALISFHCGVVSALVCSP